MTEEHSEEPTSIDKLKDKLRSTKDKLVIFISDFSRELKKMNWIQISLALVLILLGGFLSTREFETDRRTLFAMYFLIFLGVIIGAWIWVKFTNRYFDRLINLVAVHKWTRKLVAGGSFSYFEYRDPKSETTKNKLTEPIGIFITTLIAFLGLATTMVGIIRIVNSNQDIANPILWGFLAIIVPILATPLIPIAWALDDAKVKSWAKGNNTTWTVSSRYKKRFNGFITIGAIVSNLRDGIEADKIKDQLEILGGILKVGALIMFISIGLFILYYYAWFRNFLRKLTTSSLDLKTYEIQLVEKENMQFESQELEENVEELAESGKINESDQINETIDEKPNEDRLKQETNKNEDEITSEINPNDDTEISTSKK